MTRPTSPTTQVYGGFQTAYDFFNGALFGGKLPNCLITLRSAPRSYGYFHGQRFEEAHAGGAPFLTDEIALNPQHFNDRPMDKILSTLVHEMVHLWQDHFGKAPTRCYHDKQWAAQMKVVGLYPSDTALPGGKETGPKVSHYIVEGGPFALACADFVKQHQPALYQDRLRAITAAAGARAAAKRKAKAKGGGEEGEEAAAELPPKSPGRVKFTCPGCQLNAWAKPSALISCMPCSRALVQAATSAEVPAEKENADADR
jgi:hypothetical protein